MSNLDLLDVIPRGGVKPSSLKSIYSCTQEEHLLGFKPIAAYGIIMDLSRFNTDLKEPAMKKRHNPVKFGVHFLLLLKGGELYVDKTEGRDTNRRYYGVNKDMPLLEKTTLPSEVYDFFKQHSASYWPQDSYSPS